MGLRRKVMGITEKLCIPSKCVAHQIRSEKGCRNENLFIYLFQDIPYGSFNARGIIFGICIL